MRTVHLYTIGEPEAVALKIALEAFAAEFKTQFDQGAKVGIHAITCADWGSGGAEWWIEFERGQKLWICKALAPIAQVRDFVKAAGDLVPGDIVETKMGKQGGAARWGTVTELLSATDIGEGWMRIRVDTHTLGGQPVSHLELYEVTEEALMCPAKERDQ